MAINNLSMNVSYWESEYIGFCSFMIQGTSTSEATKETFRCLS